jgi:hypothetical protein
LAQKEKRLGGTGLVASPKPILRLQGRFVPKMEQAVKSCAGMVPFVVGLSAGDDLGHQESFGGVKEGTQKNRQSNRSA